MTGDDFIALAGKLAIGAGSDEALDRDQTLGENANAGTS